MVDTATTVRYTLSLHDALPISDRVDRRHLFLGSIVSRSLLATALAAAIMLHSGTAALIVLSFAFTACGTDRKSTRLNSSHLGISYAVFCLQKKNEEQNNQYPHS